MNLVIFWGSSWKVMWSHGNCFLFCFVLNMGDIIACWCVLMRIVQWRGIDCRRTNTYVSKRTQAPGHNL